LKKTYCDYVSKNCHMHATPGYWYFLIYLIYGVDFILMMVSSLMEVAATLGKKHAVLYMFRCANFM
jgi:3-methyladenine DNA glycosylase Mpg